MYEFIIGSIMLVLTGCATVPTIQKVNLEKVVHPPEEAIRYGYVKEGMSQIEVVETIGYADYYCHFTLPDKPGDVFSQYLYILAKDGNFYRYARLHFKNRILEWLEIFRTQISPEERMRLVFPFSPYKSAK